MEQQGKTENNGNSRLETGNIWKLMLSLSIPSIIAQLVGILYNMVDRMFIGRIENGTTAMAALSVSLPLITCITAFTRLVGIGGAPLCAIKMGKKDQRGEEILGVSFASLITVGVILTVVILVFQRPILTLFGADPTTLDMACDYVSIYALGTVFVMISLGMNSYITTQGFARTGMCTVLIGAILNIIFDAFFINYLHMGVKGAAIATIIAQGISCIWALSFLFGKKSLLKMRREFFKVKKKVLLPIMALGVSPFTMSITESLIQISFNNQLSKYGGTMAVGTVAIMFSLWQFVTLPTQGFCQGAQPIISYNYGAGNLARVRKACKISHVLDLCNDPHRPYDDLPRPLCRYLQQRPGAPPFQRLGASYLSGGRSDLRGSDQLPAVLHVPGTGKDLSDPGLLKEGHPSGAADLHIPCDRGKAALCGGHGRGDRGAGGISGGGIFYFLCGARVGYPCGDLYVGDILCVL